jgi:GNAT superfamily N-acetyltransferase
MKITEAKEKDIEDLIKLMINVGNRDKDWSEYRANKFVINKDKLILIAKEDNKLIGYIGIKKYEDNPAREFVNLNNYIWVTWIAILQEYRSKGIGSILLNSVEKYVKKFKKIGILLDCREKVISFYNRNEYSIVGKYQDKGAPRYVMEKQLK